MMKVICVEANIIYLYIIQEGHVVTRWLMAPAKTKLGCAWLVLSIFGVDYKDKYVKEMLCNPYLKKTITNTC